MKVWRSLRARLIFSYVALALLLLTFSGYVFSNALSMYAVSVRDSQQALYFQQARNGLLVRETLLALILGAIK